MHTQIHTDTYTPMHTRTHERSNYSVLRSKMYFKEQHRASEKRFANILK